MSSQKRRYTQTNSRNHLERDFCFRALEGEGNERKFAISFSSEEPYKRYFGNEILDHSEGAVDLTRLNTIGCVLFNHDRDEVIGRIVSCEIKNNRGEAIIEIDEDEKSEVIFQKMKSGSLKGISVGYIVDVWEDVAAGAKSEDGRFTGPCRIAKRWMPFEISVVSVPADATVGVGRDFNEESKHSLDLYERQLLINKNRIC